MTNFIIRWCLNNRLLVIMTSLVILGAGYYSLTHATIDAIPDIGEKQVIVIAYCSLNLWWFHRPAVLGE